MSDNSPATGATFMLSATVSNTGDGESAATTLRYYRSTDATITTDGHGRGLGRGGGTQPVGEHECSDATDGAVDGRDVLLLGVRRRRG